MAHSTLDLMPSDPQSPTPPAANFHLLSYFLGLLTALSLVGGSVFLLRQPDPTPVALHPPPTVAPSPTLGPTATPLPTPTPAPITIFISGAVQHPGLYQLHADGRVSDAIESAGGLTAEANVTALNQAEKLRDGAQVYVPSLTEETAGAAPAPGVSGGQPASEPGPLLSNVPAASSASGQINLNSASLAELDSLPGIGPSRAQAIIDNRPYALVDELDKVSGIGPSMIEKLRPLVTVQ